MNSSGALWKILMENPVGDSLYNWHDEQCSQFTNGFTNGILVVKIDTSSFFLLLCLNFFLTVIPSVYTERIYPSVKFLENLPTKIFSWYFCLYLSIFWYWYNINIFISMKYPPIWKDVYIYNQTIHTFWRSIYILV